VSSSKWSRRSFFSASAAAGAASLVHPAALAAQSAGVKTGDLPDLTIKEAKVYVTDIGDVRRLNGTESGEIVSLVTPGGIEGNYTLGNRGNPPGWLDYAKAACVGKNVLDLLPVIAYGGGRQQTGRGARGGGGGGNFGGGFGFAARRTRQNPASGPDIHAAICDVCLWDILGKAVNRPIYKILGNGGKDRLLAYASSQHLANVEDFGPDALKAKAAGLKGYKIHPGGGQRRSGGPIPAYLGHIEEIKEVRKAVGDQRFRKAG